MPNKPEIFFRPNNHSKFRTNWMPVEPRLIGEVKQVVEEKYGRNDVIGVAKIKEWGLKSCNYKITLADGRNMVVRKNIVYNDLERLCAIDLIHKFLNSNNIPVPVTVATENNLPICKVGDNYWQAFDFVEGDHFKGTERELVEIARNIAKLHRKLKEINFDRKLFKKTTWSKKDYLKLFRIASKGKTEIDRALKIRKTFLLKNIEEVKRRNREILKLNKDLTHGDLHPHNTIFRNGRLVTFLDFNDAKIGSHLAEMANSCYRFVRQFVVNCGGDWKEPLVKGLGIFLNHYLSECDFSEKELKLAPLLIKDELLRKLKSNLYRYYFKKNQSVLAKEEFDKIICLLNEADLVAEIMPQILCRLQKE